MKDEYAYKKALQIQVGISKIFPRPTATGPLKVLETRTDWACSLYGKQLAVTTFLFCSGHKALTQVKSSWRGQPRFNNDQFSASAAELAILLCECRLIMTSFWHKVLCSLIFGILFTSYSGTGACFGGFVLVTDLVKPDTKTMPLEQAPKPKEC